MSLDRVVFDNDIVLLCGDSDDLLAGIADASAIVTDPPYGIGHYKGPSGSVVAGRKSLRRSSAKMVGDEKPFDPSAFARFPFVLTWGANHYAARLPQGGRWFGWDKTGGGRGPKDSFSDLELAWCSAKGNAKVFHYLWKGVCQDGEKGERRHHPTQKPIALMEWCLGFAPADLPVVDPYMGAGSTALAAIRAGRRFTGIEIEREFFDKACARVEKEIAKRKGAS